MQNVQQLEEVLEVIDEDTSCPCNSPVLILYNGSQVIQYDDTIICVSVISPICNWGWMNYRFTKMNHDESLIHYLGETHEWRHPLELNHNKSDSAFGNES